MAKTPERQNERTRLQEVATLAGVSASTVSLVLSGKAGQRRISEDTRERVSRAAEDLNYAPNLLTRSLRRGRTHVISFFSTFRHRESEDFYMDKLSSAIETAGGELGYDILVHCNFRRSPKEIYQFLNGGLADGLLLFAPKQDDPLLELLRKSPLPVVLINSQDRLGQYSSVSDRASEGMDLVADRLVELGHRRIAAFHGEDSLARDSHVRISLLINRLKQHGVEIPKAWLPEVGDNPISIVKELLSQPEPPTAIFCWHDRLAYNVLAACEKLGVDVPNQVSIVGYDGLQWPSATKHTAASVHVDLGSLAKAAVRLLDLAILDSSAASTHEVVPLTFTPGTSLGPPQDKQWSHL